MKKILATVFVVAAACFGLAACGQTSGEPTTNTDAGSNRPAESAESSSAAASTTEESTNSKFGQAFKFRNGVSVSVSTPEPYVPSTSASTSNPGGQFIAFTVTVINGSQENYDPSGFSETLQSGNKEAEQVFDSANDVGGAPSTTVLPTRESTFQIAFEVTDPTDLVLQVSPGYEYRDAIFTF